MPPHNPLQLADALESLENPRLHLLPYAASELRRLHEAHEWQYKMAGERLRRIEQDEALLQQALEALDELKYCSSSHAADDIYYETITALRERLGETK